MRGLSASLIFSILASSCVAVVGPTVLLDSPQHIRPRRVYVADPDYRPSLEAAVDFWNYALDYPALAVTEHAAAADLQILIAPVNGSRVGSADPRRGLMFYHRPGDSYHAYLVFAHELGHAAFWLDHDPQQFCSVMYPELNYGPLDGPAFRCMRLPPEDRAAVRKLLGLK